MKSNRRTGKSGIASWIAYDFINSLLIINGSLYFSAWITQNQGVNSFWYGLTFSISTLLLLILLPLKGAAIDKHGIGRQMLFVLSILIGVTAIVLRQFGHMASPVWRIGGTLAAFGLINLLYQASFVPYNWLLVHLRGVKTTDDVRRVSGFGESFGSLGSVVGAILGAILLKQVLKQQETAYIDLFLWLGILFLLLFTIDYWSLCRGLEMRTGDNAESYGTLLHNSLSLLHTAGRLRRFLIAFLFYADALLTVQLYLPIYMRERLGLGDTDVSLAIVISLTAGAIGAALFSWTAKGKDLRKVIALCLAAWAITLFLFGIIASRTGFLLLIAWAGVLYGILWSASRAYLIEMTPVKTLGRTFGFYSIFERCASIIGPLLWGAIMLLPLETSWRYTCAFTVMGLLIILSIFILLFNRPESSEPLASSATA
jgi:UMF1 family MFS transporter